MEFCWLMGSVGGWVFVLDVTSRVEVGISGEGEGKGEVVFGTAWINGDRAKMQVKPYIYINTKIFGGTR